MWMCENVAVLMAKERMGEAMRHAEAVRASRRPGSQWTTRVRLGLALVRLGRWLMGEPSPVPIPDVRR
jgi:hypothetical protein